MNFPALGTVSFDMTFLSSLMSITLINLVLSGDNAVVIAMAARALPKEHRLKGIVLGATVAVLLRVVFTFFVAEMLGMDYVRLIGGAVIVWIAIKLFVEDEEAEIAHKEAASLWQAIWIIVVADLTMALDNMLAVGAASHGNLFLLLIGLGLSIPFIVFGSTLLSRLIDRFPIIIYIGAALLGKIGGEMIITDPVVGRFVTPTGVVTYSVEIAFAAGVILIGKYWLKRDMAKQGPAR
jgi:YjbE family integral membrane protein